MHEKIEQNILLTSITGPRTSWEALEVLAVLEVPADKVRYIHESEQNLCLVHAMIDAK
jgi:hypothetical protein